VDRRLILREDVALFAWAVNPFNRKRYVTICSGIYGRGTYDAIRSALPGIETTNISKRLSVQRGVLHTYPGDGENGVTLTPDWTVPATRLFEWSRTQ
jgi:hypothetical protein